MNYSLILISLLFISIQGNAQGYWKRVHGDGISDVPSAEGTYSPTNSPWGRYAAACMKDSSGTFWMYGGSAGNDLWQFDPDINQWRIRDGEYETLDGETVFGIQGVPSPTNTPGSATFGHPSWGDHEGNVWLYSVDGLNDLWRFNIETEMWTWMKGTASIDLPVYGTKGEPSMETRPGTCNETDCHWTDSDGKLWLYTEFNGNLWSYDPPSNMWTWIAGNGDDATPEYGDIDVFGPSNAPGGFSACPAVGTLYTTWITSDDHLWMFVNRFDADLQTELWEFDPVSSEWRCRRIDVSEFAAPQIYPEACLEGDLTIFPVARTEMRVEWVDDCDHLYLFGGANYCMSGSVYNDIWRYDRETNCYTYLKGGTLPVVFGTQGVFDEANMPQVMYGGQAWQNENGFYMFGGGNEEVDELPDNVWLYSADTVIADFSFITDCLEASFTNLGETGCNSFKSIHWDFGDGEESEEENPIHSYSANGFYEVQLILTNCSWDSDTVTAIVEIDCPFDINLEGDTICEGDCYQLIATSFDDTDEISFVWDNGILENNDSVMVCPDVTTTYTVIGTRDDGNIDSATATIIVIPEPIVNLGEDTVLCGGTLVLDAENVGATYLWNTGATDQLITVTESGVYSVTVTFGSCSRSDTIEVMILGPTVDLGPDTTICHLDLILDAGFDDDYTILWNDGTTNRYLNIPDTGLFYVTVTDSNGCEGIDSIYISAGTITVDLGPDIFICDEEDFILDAGIEGTYSWQDGSTGRYFTVEDSGTYFVEVRDGICFGSDTLIASKFTPESNFNYADTVGCFPFVTQFYDNSTTEEEITAWDWTFGDGETSTDQNPSHSYAASGNYTVTLEILTASGCTAIYTYNLEIIVFTKPVAAFTFTPETPQIETAVLFEDLSENAFTWDWDFGDGSGSFVQHPEHVYTTLSNYNVQLIVTNGDCIDSTARHIVVEEDLIFYVPNAFTPDGDYYNNTFQPVFTAGYDPYDYHLTIFNRWGEIVFESYNAEIGWNGTYPKCGLVQDGVYVWQIQVGISKTDERKTYVGHVTILK